MSDDESRFLDALYLGVRDGAVFDEALNLLCSLFDVASAALIDFDAARRDVQPRRLSAFSAAKRYDVMSATLLRLTPLRPLS
jgi:hypothetical protein